MRKPLAAALLFALAAAIVPTRAQPPAGQPKQGRREMPKAEWVDPNRAAPAGTQYHTFPSKVLGGDVCYLVYLPPGYEAGTKRYPVVYWLHGLGGNQRAGALSFVGPFDEAVRAGTVSPAIVVLVNGMVNSFYCDWADGKRPVESVIVKDLIPHVDQTYRTIAKREGRLIEGFSMGGYGAAHLGFKYPDLFGAVVVDAGALILESALTEGNVAEIYKNGFASDPARWRAEHPTQLVEKNADRIRGKTVIRVGVGGADRLLARNRELHELLDKLKIEHEYEVADGVGHMAPAYYKKLGDKCFAVHKKAFAAAGGEK
jgi:enterochelin esterase-like enzyme